MRIPAALAEELIEILKSYTDADFQELNVIRDLSVTVRVDFKNDTTATTYNKRVIEYVENLQHRKTTADFVRVFSDHDEENEELAALYGKVKRLYVRKNNKWTWNREAFNRPIILDRLAFLDRENIRDEVFYMVDRANPRVIRIDGQNCAGLSYIGFYLEELEGTMNCFELIRINFKRDVSLGNEGQKLAPHLAKAISDHLKLYTDSKDWSQFKITPFITELKTRISDGRPLLIFIDQFDVTWGADVDKLLEALAELAGVKRACYIVLSGYPNFHAWERELQKLAKPLDIGHGTFTREHIEDFCVGLTARLMENDLQVDSEALRASLLQVIETHITNGNGNVEIVGEKVTEWFQELENKLK